MLPETSFIAVFLLGLSGGIHCAGMCGGIVSLLGMRAGVAATPPSGNHPHRVIQIAVEGAGNAGQLAAATSARSGESDTLTLPLAYNSGRILTYTLLGLIAGGIGSITMLVEDWMPAQQTAFVIGNLVMVLSGLYLLGVGGVVRFLEALGQPLWRQVRGAAARSLQRSGPAAAVLAGGLWGLVPCGLVYSVLVMAISSGSAVHGALLLLVFGLGTLPNLLLMSWSAEKLAAMRSHTAFRWLAGGLIVAFGLFGLMRVFIAPHVPGLESFCYQP